MDSVLGDKRNLAHSASGRNPRNTDDQQIIKLKEDHQKEIQRLTYESKIELMESQMKIVNLTHQLELLKLKNSHENETKQFQADRELQKDKDELQNKLAEMKLQLTAKEHEMKVYQKEQEKENSTKEYELKLKVKDLESEHKIKMLQMEKKLTEMEKGLKEKEETIQKLRTGMGPVHEQVADHPQNEKGLIDRMVWGANCFFKRISDGPKLYDSYEEWYESLSLLMADKKLYVTPMFLFMRKEFDKHRNALDFASKRKGSAYKDNSDEFNTEGLSKELYSNDGVDLFLLHSKVYAEHLKFNRSHNGYDYERWSVKNVNYIYYTTKNSAIVLGIFRK